MSIPIQLLISDLDNTIYDWVSFFVPAFYSMAQRAAELLSIDPELLLDDLRAVHQRYGSSEHPYALLETDAVRNRFPNESDEEKKAILAPAFQAFKRTREHHLKLYPHVLGTLQAIRNRGCLVVAYTEAAVYTVVHRLALLNILDAFNAIYAPAGRGEIRPGSAVLASRVRILPPDHKKPNPLALKSICKEQTISPSNTLYIGDSLVRDVSMANRAGVRSAWAKYGVPADSALWDRLVRVTHWTPRDVENEARIREECKDATPDVALESFEDLLSSEFEFLPARKESAAEITQN